MVDQILNKILESEITNKEEHFGKEYPNFKAKYPVLFKTACDGNIDKSNLSFMMNVLERMENNGVTQHDGSVEVGQMLYSKYVEPQVKKD